VIVCVCVFVCVWFRRYPRGQQTDRHCVSVCLLSTWISPEPRARAIFTNFSVHVACGRGVARSSSGRVTKSQGEGVIFWGLSGSFKSIGNLRCSRRYRVCCKRDHSIANNVMQQKGSFNMPGKRKIGIRKILSAGDAAYQTERVMGVHSGGDI